MGRSRAAGDCQELVFTAASSLMASVVVGVRRGIATTGAPPRACSRGLGCPCGPNLGPRGPRPTRVVGVRFRLGRCAVRRIWYGAVLRLNTRAGCGTGCSLDPFRQVPGTDGGGPCTTCLREALRTDLVENLLSASCQGKRWRRCLRRSLLKGIVVEKFKTTLCYLRGKP